MPQLLFRCALTVIGGAIGTIGLFAVVKGIFGWPAGGFRDNALLLGCGIWAVSSYLCVLEIQRFVRQSDARKLAKRWSFRFAEKGNPDVAKDFGLRISKQDAGLIGESNLEFTLENVIQGSRDGVNVLIADMTTRNLLGDNDRDTTQTIINLRGRDFCFPAFTLLPTAMTYQSIGKLEGKPNASNEPSARSRPTHRLSSSQADMTRAEVAGMLYGEDMQRYLASDPGWLIFVDEANVLLARIGQEPVSQWGALVDDSLGMLKLLQRSVDRLANSAIEIKSVHGS